MIYINGIPVILKKKLKSRQILSFFIILFIIVCFLTFFSLPDLSNVLSKGSKQEIFPIDNYSINGVDGNFKPYDGAPMLNNLELVNNKPGQILDQNIHDIMIAPETPYKDTKFNEIIKNKYINNDKEYADIEKMEKVKSMMKHAWDGYHEYAFGDNELKPMSRSSHYGSVFGNNKIGLTIVDSLDTLLVMGLFKEYQEARNWIPNLSFNQMKGTISVFETSIRYIGGLLAAYLLTEDELLLTKAIEVADAIMPAFETEYGLPYSLVNINSHVGQNYFWAKSNSFILAEIGTLHLEYQLLSILSGNNIYYDKVAAIRKFMNSSTFCDHGLVNNYIKPSEQNTTTRLVDVSLGGLGDSYYEYLIKSYFITDEKDVQGKEMFYAALEGINKKLLKTTSSGLSYLAQIRSGVVEHTMDHLACFFGGLLALTSTKEKNIRAKKDLLNTAEKLATTCRLGYTKATLRLSPEVLSFTSTDTEAKAPTTKQSYYILRPETFETYFYMWRITKDTKYRDWAWDAVLALEKNAKIGVGYSGIRNVYDPNPEYDDVQQSYFMAETLKYLYLTFAPLSYLSLDDWVFNTEGHPFLKHSLLPSTPNAAFKHKIPRE